MGYTLLGSRAKKRLKIVIEQTTMTFGGEIWGKKTQNVFGSVDNYESINMNLKSRRHHHHHQRRHTHWKK